MNVLLWCVECQDAKVFTFDMKKLAHDKQNHRLLLGLAIRNRRHELHLSQEQLAEIADVHRNFVGKVERGEQNVSIDSLMRFATSLKTPLSTIISDAGL